MQKNKITLFFILFAFLLQSCFIGADDKYEIIAENYYLSGDHNFKNVNFGFEDSEFGGIGLVKAPIKKLGLNDNYIIINRGYNGEEYFIVKIIQTGKYSTASDNVYGSYSLIEFKDQVEILDIKDIEWSKNFEN